MALASPSLAPLFAAPFPIQLHVLAAAAAFALGLAQFARAKGNPSHRLIGYIWCAAMLVIAFGSFWIHELKHWNGLSAIHLLSIFVLAMLPLGVRAARAGEIARHRRIMIGLFFGGLLVAGAFTLWPGRIMHAVVFGGG